MSPVQRQLAATLIPISLALASLAISAFSSYADNDKDLTSRIIAVETRQETDHEMLRDMKVKIDRIYDRVAGW